MRRDHRFEYVELKNFFLFFFIFLVNNQQKMHNNNRTFIFFDDTPCRQSEFDEVLNEWTIYLISCFIFSVVESLLLCIHTYIFIHQCS